MAALQTGPLNVGGYEALESEAVKGLDLFQAQGEFGLAVSYADTAFRFRGEVSRVLSRSGTGVILMDVMSLDGRSSYEMPLRADPITGLIEEQSLQHRPISSIGDSTPQSAFLYDAQAAEILGDERLGNPDIERFLRLGEAQTKRAENDPVIASAAGIVAGARAVRLSGYEVKKPRSTSQSGRRPRMGLLGGVLLVPLPKGSKR